MLIHLLTSQPALIKLDNENIGGHLTPLHRVLIKKHCATKTVNLHVRLTQIVLELVPCRWSSDSKGATAVRIELKLWNNE